MRDPQEFLKKVIASLLRKFWPIDQTNKLWLVLRLTLQVEVNHFRNNPLIMNNSQPRITSICIEYISIESISMESISIESISIESFEKNFIRILFLCRTQKYAALDKCHLTNYTKNMYTIKISTDIRLCTTGYRR